MIRVRRGSHRRARLSGVLAVVAAAASAGLLLTFWMAQVVATRPPLSEQAKRCHDLAAQLPPPEDMDVSQTDVMPRSPFYGHPLWTPPYPAADAAARALRATDPQGADLLVRVASTPRAVWLTDPSVPGPHVRDEVAGLARQAAHDNGVLTLVLYGLPLRDCAGASRGGAATGAQYRAWIRDIVDGLQSARQENTSGPGVGVVVEPDSLGQLTLLPDARRSERLSLLAGTVATFATLPWTGTYLDAGHSDWVDVDEMADRLTDAGVAMARGFSLNVSGYGRTQDEIGYGKALARLVGDKHFVVDVSRNGSGPSPDAAWCNPPGRALGQAPTAVTADPVDAVLWVKAPAESDGDCRPGEPAAGQFWPARALALARAARW